MSLTKSLKLFWRNKMALLDLDIFPLSFFWPTILKLKVCCYIMYLAAPTFPIYMSTKFLKHVSSSPEICKWTAVYRKLLTTFVHFIQFGFFVCSCSSEECQLCQLCLWCLKPNLLFCAKKQENSLDVLKL